MQRQLIEAVIGLVGPDATAQDLCVLRNQDVLLESSVGGTTRGLGATAIAAAIIATASVIGARHASARTAEVLAIKTLVSGWW